MITRLEEKRGGWIKLDCESTHFKNYIHNNRLIDMEFNNGVYTWNKKHADVHQIASRLDRFLISYNAIHLGGDTLASILPLSARTIGLLGFTGKDWETMFIGPFALKPFG